MKMEVSYSRYVYDISTLIKIQLIRSYSLYFCRGINLLRLSSLLLFFLQIISLYYIKELSDHDSYPSFSLHSLSQSFYKLQSIIFGSCIINLSLLIILFTMLIMVWLFTIMHTERLLDIWVIISLIILSLNHLEFIQNRLIKLKGK